MKLDSNTINELVELLRPFMEDEGSRRPFLVLALGNNSPVLQRINWSGSVATFIPDMVCKLADYGEVAPGRQALWVLLEYVRSQVGVDVQQRMDKLRPLIDLQAPYSTSSDTISSVTVEPGLLTKNLHDIPTANFNGCFIVDRVNYESLPNGSRVYSFDVFNKGYADGVVEVRNARGELIEFRGIEGIRNSTNILGFGIQSIERLWRLATEGYEFLDPRNSLGNSQNTEIRNIVVPPEGTLTITKKGNRALIYNQATFLLRLFLDHEAIFLEDSPSVKARLLSALCAKLQQEHIGSLVREGTLITQSDAIQALITGRWIDKENLDKLTQIGLQALAEKGLKRIANIVINEQVLGKSLSFWTTSAEVFVKGANVFLQWLDLDRSQRAEEKTVTLFISERS